jgi:UDPglucose 6-dehydrogenase
LAAKVSFFSEIESFCQSRDINYDMVREGITLDDRITDSHTMVPGHDGKRGYGGTCFPKDINSLLYQFGEAGVPSPMIEASIFRNENIDRAGKDWEFMKGRSVL